MNRIERISAILIQLQSKKVVTAKEIADRFDVSLRTVYRDMRALEETGVPISAEAGIGYSIMDGYKLPPVQFTLNEATAFITAEKLIEKLTDTGIVRDYQSALFKIKAILRSSEKNHLETLENKIEVVNNPYLPEIKHEAGFLQQLISAISAMNVIKMTYYAIHSQETTSRTIEPIGIFLSGNKWHLIAYCRLRKDYRNFRLDRIRELVVSDQHFDKTHPSLKSFLDKVANESEMFKVELEFENEVLKYLGEQKYYHGFVSQKKIKSKTIMTFLTPSLEGIARWYLMMGDHTKIISPTILKKRVTALMQDMKKNLA